MPTETKDAATSTFRLSATGLEKYYGAVHALQGVDLAVEAGEFVALVGDNGAGKSTLVKMLAGVVAQSAGRIECDGRQVTLSSPNQARELGVETVYQDLGLCENLTVAENIYLGREPVKGWGPLRRIDTKRMTREVSEVLGGLSVNVPSPHALVSQLSGGQRQAVAISRCRLWKQRMVILDEPTAALGVQESERVIDAVTELHRGGAAIVLVSHDIPLIMRLASRVVVLRRGLKVADVARSEVTEQDVVGLITGALDYSAAQNGRVE